MAIIKILNHPLARNFDESLTELVKKYKKLERGAKKRGSQY